MAITSQFSTRGTLNVQGDTLANAIDISRNAAGTLLVNGGAVPISGGSPTVLNTRLVTASGGDGDDTMSMDEGLGALPRANLSGGNGNDTMSSGSGDDLLLGDAGNDTMFAKGGTDLMHGGDGNDTLVGGAGNDVMHGDAGDDRLVWNPGDGSDLFDGGDGVDTAEVNGGNGSEVFTLTANGTGVRFDRVSPAPFAIDASAMEQFVVRMNGGDDAFSATGNLAALVGLSVDGGAGNDTILGSNGADTLSGGDGNDFIDGQQGADTAFLGAGDDLFQWDPGDGSDVVEGQDGSDTMLFFGSNASENINIVANGGRVLFHRDVANVTMDLDDLERIEFRALGGADNIVVGDLSGTDTTRVDVDLRGPNGGADGQADSVTANATNGADVFGVAGDSGGVQVFGLAAAVNLFFADASDRLTLNGQAGDDVIDATGLQAGAVQLTMNGGLGADVFLGSAGGDLFVGGDGNDLALMGAGDDTFVWNPGDDNDTLEGQAGSDTMLFNGANVAENIDISAHGGRVIFFRNVANVVMDLNDTETIDFRALGGADNIVINDLSGTDVTEVRLDLGAAGGAGDGQADTVTVNATSADDVVVVTGDAGEVVVLGLASRVTITGFEAGVDRLVVNLLDGADVLEASGLTATGMLLTGNGGNGDDVLVGGDGNDTLAGGAGDDVLIGGPGIDVLDGGVGDNVVIQLVGTLADPLVIF